MARTADQEIIVVKKKIEPEVHGGSAWKVAYADFVTAMMAFFLLLWLLNATTEDQKQGISNYFEPVGATKGSTGSGGVVGDRRGQLVARKHQSSHLDRHGGAPVKETQVR